MAIKSKRDNERTSAAKGGAAETRMSTSERVRWIAGLVVAAAGLFITFAVLSHFLHWKVDASTLHPATQADTAKPIENVCGIIGARAADALTRGSFGVFGLLVPIIAVLLGVRTIRRRSLFFNHSTLSITFIMILGSLTLGLALGNRWEVFQSGWGGTFGIFVAEAMKNTIGMAGAIIVLVLGWILTGVFININFIGTVNDGVESVFSGAESLWTRLQNIDLRKSKTKKSAVSESAAEPSELSVFEPVQMPESEPPQIAEAEPESEDEEIIREPTEQNVVGQPCVAIGEVQTVNDWYRNRGLVSDDDAHDGKNENIVEEFETDDNPDIVEFGGEHDEPETEHVPEKPRAKPNYGIEEFDIDDDGRPKPADDSSDESADDADEPQSGQTAENRLGTIIVEEHHEKQVRDGEIGSLYDPMKDIPNYRCPSTDLLVDHSSNSHVSDEEITSNKQRIEETLASFGIPIRDMKATVGPTVTLYEIVQEQGVQISKIRKLDNDIAQSLKALGIRIIAPIPGRGTIGIEVPNQDKETVSMRSAILSKRFQQFDAELPVVIGRTIQNENYVFDLAKMPHLLVAGATGQGKSVGLNAIITSLLYRKHPSQLKFVMIDPKMVEFSLYARLEKHFLAKMQSEDEVIITDPKKAVNTLQSLCIEMGNRLELCKKAGAKNIVEYNEKFLNRRLNPANGHCFMPYIVVVIDEFADLIMMAKEVEAPVMRLAQKARAIGIHLIIATQRPDVKVITGGIKANFPSRIAFRVMSMTDSRTIIDQPGANQLIGRGDMLFSKNGELTRIQCAFIDTPEVENIVDAIASQRGYTEAYPLPDYEEAGANTDMGGGSSGGSDLGGGAVKYDTLFADIARDAVQNGQISVSYIQRNYEVGFNRAGRIMSQLERAGIVGPQIGAKQRDIKFYDMPSLEAKLQDLGLS